MKITTYTDSVEGIFNYSPWLIKEQGEWREVKVTQWRFQGKAVVASLEGVETRDQAQMLTNCEIAVSAEQMQELPEDEFYWRELFGMQVFTTKGYDLGEVTDLLETGSNDVLVIKANLKDAFGQKERLVPYLEEQVIKKVDREARRIEVDWDPGF